jgi:hypothetical protein
MAPNEEVVGSIPHAGVVLTMIVHPTMMGGPWTLLYGYLKVRWGDTMGPAAPGGAGPGPAPVKV